MEKLKISLDIEKNGQKISGNLEGDYQEAKKLLDELFSKIQSKSNDAKYNKAQQKVLQLRDKGFLDKPKTTIELLKELNVKFGIKITPNHAPNLLLPLLDAGEIDRAHTPPSQKLPKGEYRWFKPGIKVD